MKNRPKEKVIKTHERVKALEKKTQKMKTSLTKLKIDNFMTKVRKFVTSETDYMIFLIMLFIVSSLFESVGLSKTIPLIIIVPFALGTFYASKKKVFWHTVIAIVILASVASDANYAAYVVMFASLCTFAGLYLAKYLDEFKKYGMIKKIIAGCFALLMVVVSIMIYSLRFGTPLTYLLAKDKIIEYAEEKYADELVYAGISYDHAKNIYNAEYLNSDGYTDKIKIGYDSKSKEIVDGYSTYLEDKYGTEIINTIRGLVASRDATKLDYIESIDITFDNELNNYKLNQNYDYKTPFSINVKLKDILIDDFIEDSDEDEASGVIAISGDDIYENVRDDTEFYFIKDAVERLTTNISSLTVTRYDELERVDATLLVKYEFGNIVENSLLKEERELEIIGMISAEEETEKAEESAEE